jgi:sugar (pentulose or hexulose) kinase
MDAKPASGIEGRARLDAGATIVIDVGKTLSKVSLWDAGGRMLDRQVRPNAPAEAGSIRRLDTTAIGEWLVEALARYAGHPVTTIIPVGHAAGVAAVVDDTLAFLPLDYEQAIPPPLMAAYREQRDPFAITGSPPLPDGLNIGSQLWWLERLEPEAIARATLLPWAQYWAWFLSGTAVSEVTSLGCHSDLWAPREGDFAPMAKRLGWAERFAPLARAGDVVGSLRPEIAAKTGLSPNVRVLAGLHDSNAALLAARGLAEIADNEATVLSTGTWFVGMRLPANLDATSDLPEARDCLVNVDVFGRAIPSARFMGGREIENLIERDTRRVDIKPDQPALLAALPEVIAQPSMILPTLARGFGPFPDGASRWINRPANWDERRAAACLYAALVADAALDLIGSSGRLIIEGRFAEAEVFVRSLASLRLDTKVFTANALNDVSFGALRLIDPGLEPLAKLVRVEPLPHDITPYRKRWHAEVAAAAKRAAP